MNSALFNIETPEQQRIRLEKEAAQKEAAVSNSSGVSTISEALKQKQAMEALNNKEIPKMSEMEGLYYKRNKLDPRFSGYQSYKDYLSGDFEGERTPAQQAEYDVYTKHLNKDKEKSLWDEVKGYGRVIGTGDLEGRKSQFAQDQQDKWALRQVLDGRTVTEDQLQQVLDVQNLEYNPENDFRSDKFTGERTPEQIKILSDEKRKEGHIKNVGKGLALVGTSLNSDSGKAPQVSASYSGGGNLGVGRGFNDFFFRGVK